MNDQDKEAFEKWMKDEDRHDGVFGNNNNFTRDEWVADKAWQAACEYKQKKIDSIDCYIERDEKIKKLQAENATFKRVLERLVFAHHVGGEKTEYIGAYNDAIQALKELEEK